MLTNVFKFALIFIRNIPKLEELINYLKQHVDFLSAYL